MGTRFIATAECIAHQNYKAKIVKAGDRATMTTGHSLGHPVRALRNPMARKFDEMERTSCTEEEIIEFGTGKLRLAAEEGDMINGSLMAGQSSGLVRDVVTVREVMERMVAEAEQIIAGLQGGVK
jgi:enoyl-[acyl-carrier protein] reductase II